jgi:outer membrane receptor for ferrienterochelin and colicins
MSARLLRRIAAACVAVLATATLGAHPLQAQAGTVSGKVTDAASGNPVSGAQVTVAGTRLGAVSGDDGTYRIANVPAGTYTVIARRIGYQELRQGNVTVAAGASASVNLVMRETENILTAVAVTGTRNEPEKVLESPNQIAVISSERISERPAVTVADNLRATAGVDINRGGIAQANIVARGFNNAFSGSMLMLQDYRFAGVPSLRVNVPFLFTGTNEDIDRMEVLLGPASALYGPNSANGVLHVITKSPFTSQGTTVSVDGGERSVLRAGLRHAGLIGEKVGFKLSGEVMRGNDWQYDDPAEPNTFSQFAPPDRRGQANARSFNLERFTGEARVDVRPREGMELISTVGHTNVGSGIELTGANGSAQIRNWTYTNIQQRFRWNRLFAQAFVNLSDAGNESGTASTGTFLLRSGQPIADKSRVAAFQLQHGFDMAAGKQTFTYGLDYIWTNPQTLNTINGSNEDRDNVTEYGGYLQSTTRPNDKLDVLLAARFDANNVIEGGFVSPRAAIVFKPSATQNFRVTYNRAFSTPANFAFFLDLINQPNLGGSGYDLRVRGNTPKTGLSYRRGAGCAGSAFGDFCMKSPLVGNGAYVPARSGSAFGPLVTANGAGIRSTITPALIGALQQAGIPAANAQALGTALAQGLVTHLGSRAPTNQQLATRVAFINNALVNLSPEALQPINPLAAAFNNTYELGYKGVIGKRATLDISLWRQQRGDVGTSAALSTPNVFFDGQNLGQFIGGEVGAFTVPFLIQNAGLTLAQATQLATGIAGALAPALAGNLARAPLGVVTFDGGDDIRPNGLYATYLTVNKQIWVSGLDLAGSLTLTDRWSVDATFSHMNRNVFEGIPGGNGVDLMANSPRNRGTFGARFDDAVRGITFEARARYAESHPVNSGVYATGVAFPIPPGNPGAVANAQGGVGRCGAGLQPGTYCYEDVPEIFQLDLQVAKRFDLAGKRLLWSINAQNALDNKVRTFPGTPEIGRLVMTRLQYSF